MLKRMFALSNQGSRDLNKGIAATTLSNLCLIAPVSLLVMVIWELLNVISGQESSMRDHAALFICGTVVMFIIVFLTQWLQYNKRFRGFWGACESVAWELDCLFCFSGNHSEMGRI